MAVITISEEPGALGHEVAARVAGQLGFLLVDRALLSKLWREVDLDETTLESADDWIPVKEPGLAPEREASVKLLADLIAQLAEENDLVIIGQGTQGLFHNRTGTLHVRVHAPRRFRVRQMQTGEQRSTAEARKQARMLERRRSCYLRYFYGLNWNDSNLYDLAVRMDRLSVGQAVRLIITAVDEMGIRQVPRNKIVEDLLPEATERPGNGRFANDAEVEFANFLDFYQIPYDYEPRSFPLKTNADGDVLEAFTPDFYLREQDLYIELTTMKQSLVTRKNRKVRRLRQLYPKINIRIFYRRDFYCLLAKFGVLTEDPAKCPVNPPPKPGTLPSPARITGDDAGGCR